MSAENDLREAVKLTERSALAVERLVPALRDSPLSLYAYTIKSRVKSASQILHKVARKRQGLATGGVVGGETPQSRLSSHYDVLHVTDGCGARVVVRFQDDIPLVVEHLLQMIFHPESVTAPVFTPGALEEAVIYTSRPDGDDLSVVPAVQRVLEQAGVRSEVVRTPIYKKSGYSSVHLVAKVHLNDGSADDTLVEIQVRDLFEEAWGEVEWALRYQIDREKTDISRIGTGLDVAWERHLNALKTFCDGCSQHATIIRRDAIDVAARDDRVVEHPAVEPAGTLAEQLGPFFAKAPEAAHQLRTALAAAERARNAQDPQQVAGAFEEAQLLLRALLDVTKVKWKDVLESTGPRSVREVVRLELAYCLSHPDAARASLEEAHKIYSEILAKRSVDVLVSYRLALVERALGNWSISLSLLKIAAKQLKPNTLPDDNWLWSAVHRQTGYGEWKLGRELDGDRTQHYRAAYRSALKGLREADTRDIPREAALSVNNAAYFAVEYYLTARPNVPNTLKRKLRELGERLQELEARKAPGDSMRRRDTILYVEMALGNTATAEAIADKLSAELRQVAEVKAGQPGLSEVYVPHYLHGDLLEIYQHIAAFRLELHGYPHT